MAYDYAGEKQRTCEAILRYVEANPLAADTADGIRRHWLPARGHERAADHIAAVLDDLVALRLLRAELLPDGKTLYRSR